MFDEQDFFGAEELLGDDERAEGVARAGPSVADDVRIAEIYAIGSGGIDTGVHAGNYQLASVEE